MVLRCVHSEHTFAPQEVSPEMRRTRGRCRRPRAVRPQTTHQTRSQTEKARAAVRQGIEVEGGILHEASTVRAIAAISALAGALLKPRFRAENQKRIAKKGIVIAIRAIMSPFV